MNQWLEGFQKKNEEIFGGGEAQQGEPGADLIKKYKENDINGWAMQFAGEALLENGVGGNYLKALRNLIVKSGVIGPDDEGLKKGNDIMNLASGIIKTVLEFVKDSKVAQPYITGAGAGLVIKGALLHYENENTIAPQIKEVNPAYYNKNIQRIYRYQGGGAGASNEW